MLDTQMLIGANFVAGADAPEAVINPKTEETIVTLPDASPAQVDAAVEAAAKAFQTWSRTTPAERSGLLLKLADAIDRDAEAFAALEALNTGKPRIRVLQDEMPAISDCFRFFAGAARNMHGAVAGEYMAGHTSMIRRDPIGVVGSIAPWNYPLMMAAWKLAPALAGGNTIVLKPSEQTPLTTLKLAKIIADIFPEGVVNVVTGRGATTGNALINHPKIAMVSLTGSIDTGRKVLQAASATIKRTHLELGGKAPVIVFDDADIASVVAGLKSFGYYNAGQDCTAACRVYAGKKVYDNLVADLSSAIKEIKYNLPNDDENEIGPLISKAQKSRVAGFVDRAAKGEAHFDRCRREVPRRQGLLLRADRRRGRACRTTRSCARRCSAPSCRSRASTTSTRRWRGPMTATMGSPRRYGPPISAKAWRRQPGSTTAAPGSTRISCW